MRLRRPTVTAASLLGEEEPGLACCPAIQRVVLEVEVDSIHVVLILIILAVVESDGMSLLFLIFPFRRAFLLVPGIIVIIEIIGLSTVGKVSSVGETPGLSGLVLYMDLRPLVSLGFDNTMTRAIGLRGGPRLLLLYRLLLALIILIRLRSDQLVLIAAASTETLFDEMRSLTSARQRLDI